MSNTGTEPVGQAAQGGAPAGPASAPKRVLRILVVDDERIGRLTTAHQLAEAGYVAEAIESASTALRRIDEAPWDVVLTDLRMPGMDGIAFLREIKRRSAEVEVIVMTAYGTVETAVAAMQEGAADYLEKPFRFPALLLRLRRIERMRAYAGELGRLRAILDEGGTCCAGMVGRSAAMQRVCDRIHLFADGAAPLLVSGETGTGKELVARAIHEVGARRAGPFVAVACGAVPRELAESQLFGHEKGSFTGAVGRRKGCFELADRGTLLLDDVDDLGPEVQVKLLRALQEGVITRVGGEGTVPVDVRVIATTKVDLSRAATEGRFRDDLFYRLRGLEIVLPPLRERGDDLLLLAQHFLRVLAAGESARPSSISAEAARVLRAYSWPGNVRELRRVMESAVALCRDAEVRPEHLPDYLANEPAPARPYALRLDDAAMVELPDLVRQFEEEVIGWAMRHAHGQQTRAAELLGIPRTTLQSKLGRPPR